MLDDVDLDLHAGEVLALVGPNGTGKSTLLAVVAGDLEPDSGTVSVLGRPVGDWRLQALAFKAIRRLMPDYPLWRDFPYEYEFDKLAIDVINGGPTLREWVDDQAAHPSDLDRLAGADETRWREEIAGLLLY